MTPTGATTLTLVKPNSQRSLEARVVTAAEKALARQDARDRIRSAVDRVLAAWAQPA
jgi:hypothetical protein